MLDQFEKHFLEIIDRNQSLVQKEKNYLENKRKLYILDFEKIENLKVDKRRLDKINTSMINSS